MRSQAVERVPAAAMILGGVLMLMLPLAPQRTAAQDAEDAAAEAGIEEIIVTGSRIRRSVDDSIAPIATLGGEVFAERGYISVADALNEVTSIVPQRNLAPGTGATSGPGQQFPELFGLGTGRTLSLVNGRRFVTSSTGLGDAQVDSNVIPTGLIERIEIVQAGAAAVYGSDAIAGVVNYILKDDFEGVEFDAQYGQSKYDDYAQKQYRLTLGRNFAGGRGNFALNAEWASSPPLRFTDRPRTSLDRVLWANPADTGPNDGIPSRREVINTRFWEFTQDGVIFTLPAPVPIPPCGFMHCLMRVDGQATQFAPNGNIVAYDPGDIFFPPPFAEGGEGFAYSGLTGLRTAVERTAANAIGHYDLTDSITLRAELLFAETEGTETPQGFARTVLSPPPYDAIIFFASNPFLTPEALATISAARPGFPFGQPLWLSRHFYFDLLPENDVMTKTRTSRVLLGLEGEFEAAEREFYWSVSASLGKTEGESRGWEVHNANFQKAIFAFPDGAGGAACLVNIDGNPANDDPACAPLNPFGFGNISEEARRYTTVLGGTDYDNEQIDMLATIGTSLFTLPAGDIEAVLAYERRDESADFTPLATNQQGVFGTGAPEMPASGDYKTDELSVETLVPIVGPENDFALARGLEFSGTYRYVDNTLAGTESVWSAGLNWKVVDSVVVRVSRSRNFRAPTLTQLTAPSATALTQSGFDPCDADRISSGPNPSVRRQNCEAEWAANPQFGPLEGFQSPAENFVVAQVTSGGNPNLSNEISDTTTYGIILRPPFAQGLTLAADRIEIDLQDGLSAFTPGEFSAACYDNSPQPADICATFRRLSMATDTLPAGTIVEAISTTFNAGIIKYEGEYYYLNYDAPLSNWFGGNPGDLSLSLEATHTSLLTTSVRGSTFERTDDTEYQPDLVMRFNAHYSRGPLRLTYQLYHLSAVTRRPDATIENDPNPHLGSNATHSLSAQYDIGNFTVRAGVVNLTNEEPSYPSFVHGDILGRRWFVGLSGRIF